MIEEAENTSLVGNNRVCSNEGSGENRGSNGASTTKNRRERRNCYSYREFGHLARNCRNWEIGSNWRMEHKKNRQNNLNGDRGLIGPN